jgi:hypothetical protein
MDCCCSISKWTWISLCNLHEALQYYQFMLLWILFSYNCDMQCTEHFCIFSDWVLHRLTCFPLQQASCGGIVVTPNCKFFGTLMRKGSNWEPVVFSYPLWVKSYNELWIEETWHATQHDILQPHKRYDKPSSSVHCHTHMHVFSEVLGKLWRCFPLLWALFDSKFSSVRGLG